MTLLAKLEVCGVCKKFKRFGEKSDGGYVTCMDHIQDGHIRAAYSMGVNKRDKWSEDWARIFSQTVYQYDCTIERPPPGCGNCTFFRKCLRPRDGTEDKFPGRSWTLTEALQMSGMAGAPDRSLVLKIDLEGSELPILASEEKQVLMKFQQIMIEFHALRGTGKHALLVTALDNLFGAGFSIVHFHGNNWAGTAPFGDYYLLPEAIELTLEAGAAGGECLVHLDHRPEDRPNNPMDRERRANLPKRSEFSPTQRFDQVDVDRDGAVSPYEFTVALAQQDASEQP